MPAGYPPQGGAPGPHGVRAASLDRLPGQTPAPSRTDPALYQWDHLSTEQQEAVLHMIHFNQRGGMSRMSRVMRVTLTVLVVVGLLAAFVLLALMILHLSSGVGIAL